MEIISRFGKSCGSPECSIMRIIACSTQWLIVKAPIVFTQESGRGAIPPLIKVMHTVITLIMLLALAAVLLNIQITIDSVMEAIIISRQNSSRSPGRLPQ
ncbi:hypothetical protein D3C85_1536080 [compost metagenome]